MEPPNAAIMRIIAPLDHAALFQAVDQAGDGDGLDLEDLGEFFLREAGLLIEAVEHDPLGAGEAVDGGAPVRVQAKLAGEVVQQEQEVGLIGHGYYNKQRYVLDAIKLSCGGRGAGLRAALWAR